MRVDLGRGIGVLRVERRVLVLRHPGGAAEHLRGGGMVDPRRRAGVAHGLEQPDRGHAVDHQGLGRARPRLAGTGWAPAWMARVPKP